MCLYYIQDVRIHGSTGPEQVLGEETRDITATQFPHCVFLLCSRIISCSCNVCFLSDRWFPTTLNFGNCLSWTQLSLSELELPLLPAIVRSLAFIMVQNSLSRASLDPCTSEQKHTVLHFGLESTLFNGAFRAKEKIFQEQMELYYSRNARSEFELCRALTHLVHSGQGTFLLKTTNLAIQDNLTASVSFF